MPPPPTPAPPARRAGPPWRAILLLSALVAALVAGAVWREPLREGFALLESAVREAGWAGPLLYVAIYVVWTVAGLPGSVVTVAGASIFAETPLVALAAVSAGSTLGAAACFVIARHVAREPVRRWIGERGVLATLDRATERHGAWVVAATRLVPLFPFTLLNYAFGLTRVRFWTYLVVSWACMLPATAVYVLGTSAVTRGLREGRVPWPLVAGAAFALGLAAVAGVVARRRWHAARIASNAPTGDPAARPSQADERARP